ncbi:hypothetical protein Q7C36_000008 [Tachysurus vachellii]|uniref:Uncharacterized protein n=1 Tax=Tachysurus vachellii TaxID=175792 RepID=A0AA88P0F7_TACVA|nr:hypothetical protein Q7C36_000008 [Tachysurus vachellii]
MFKQVDRLTKFIKPACPNDKVLQCVADNTNQWMQGNMRLLLDHYTVTQSSLLSNIYDWIDVAWEQACKWARNRYKYRLKVDTLTVTKNLILDQCSLNQVDGDTQLCDLVTSNVAVPMSQTILPCTVNFDSIREASSGLDKEAMMKGVLPEASSLVSLSPRSSVVPLDLSFSSVADTSVRDVSFKVTPAQHADIDRTRAPHFPVKHPRSTRKIQEWHLKVYKPVIFVGDSNLARIPQFYNPSVQVDSFPGANFLHISKVLQKLTPNPNTQKVILALGINNKDQLFQKTSKKTTTGIVEISGDGFSQRDSLYPCYSFL